MRRFLITKIKSRRRFFLVLLIIYKPSPRSALGNYCLISYWNECTVMFQTVTSCCVIAMYSVLWTYDCILYTRFGNAAVRWEAGRGRCYHTCSNCRPVSLCAGCNKGDGPRLLRSVDATCIGLCHSNKSIITLVSAFLYRAACVLCISIGLYAASFREPAHSPASNEKWQFRSSKIKIFHLLLTEMNLAVDVSLSATEAEAGATQSSLVKLQAFTSGGCSTHSIL